MESSSCTDASPAATETETTTDSGCSWSPAASTHDPYRESDEPVNGVDKVQLPPGDDSLPPSLGEPSLRKSAREHPPSLSSCGRWLALRRAALHVHDLRHTSIKTMRAKSTCQAFLVRSNDELPERTGPGRAH